MRRVRLLVVAAVLGAWVAGCGTGGGSPAAAPGVADGATTLTVFAAASLKNTFSTLGRSFESAHPGTRVTFSFAGSADLAAQLQAGAPADVFAAADEKNMTKVTADQLVRGTPQVFATNRLEIAVPPDNPAGIASFADLAKPGVRLVTCAVEVPCGAATRELQQAAGAALRPVSEESSVTDVLGKVQSGEADAGLVYVTDVRAAGARVKGVAVPEARRAVNRYPIATLAKSRQPELAAEFLQLVTGAEGQQVLGAAGFGRP